MTTDSPVRVLDGPMTDLDAYRIGCHQSKDVASLAMQLASAVADVADADQWAIALSGVSGTGPADFEELVPRRCLQLLNDGRAAAYRLTLILHTEAHDLGVLRLATLRPSGFSPEDVIRARKAAESVAQSLCAALKYDERSAWVLAS